MPPLKLAVFDLDDTLVDVNMTCLAPEENAPIVDCGANYGYATLRPFAVEFLQALLSAGWYLAIWSAASAKYVDEIARIIDNAAKTEIPWLFKWDCSKCTGWSLLKDLDDVLEGLFSSRRFSDEREAYPEFSKQSVVLYDDCDVHVKHNAKKGYTCVKPPKYNSKKAKYGKQDLFFKQQLMALAK